MAHYGYDHQQVREALLPLAYGRACHHCGKTMRPGQALDLDHTADGQSYRGIAHASCNRRDGAQKQQRRKRRRRKHSREW